MQIAPSTPAATRSPALVEHLHVEAGHRHRRRTRLDRHRLQPAQVGHDRPAGLGLPPVVDDRHAEPLGRPVVGVRVEPLAGQEERAQARAVVTGHQRAVRVLLLDRPDRRRRGEEPGDAVLGDDPPERPGIRRTNRFALVEHRRAAGQQGRVDDVGVADDPADVAGRPPHLARPRVVDVGHRPAQRDGVAAVVADDALRLAGRAARVEHVERVGRLHRNAFRRVTPRPAPSARPSPGRAPPSQRRRRAARGVAAQRCTPARASRASSAASTSGLYSTTRAPSMPHDAVTTHDRLGVVDPGGQLGRREPAEHHRVHGAEPRAGQHRDDRLGDHRQVDHDPVALAHPELAQHPGEPGRPAPAARRRSAGSACRSPGCRG